MHLLQREGSAAPLAAAASAMVSPPRELIPRGVKVPPFEIREAPSAQDVPKSPLRGSANGHRFEVKRIQIEAQIAAGWVLSLIGPARSPTTRWQWDAEYIQVAFRPSRSSKRPYESSALTQKLFRKPMDQNSTEIDVSFRFVDPKDQTQTTTVPGNAALYLEFTSWEVEPWHNRSPRQVAGVASGKIYVALDGGRKFEASGLAGEFKDVPVSRTLVKP